MVCVKPIRRSDSKSMWIMVVCFLIPVRRAIPFAVKRIGGEYGKSAARVRADQHTTGGSPDVIRQPTGGQYLRGAFYGLLWLGKAPSVAPQDGAVNCLHTS